MSEIVLKTKGLTKYFGDFAAVDHLDLEIKKGSICGFLGRNGAGKTTTIKMLLGLLKPTEGKSQLFGCDSQKLTNEIKAKVGYVTEGHRLFGAMTIKQIQNYQKAFYPKTWSQSLFDEMIEYFQLPKKKKIKKISKGQKAQVSLALTLATNPELLIMDDPTLGLDAAIRRQFLESMIELITKQGRTILFSSHILSDVERVADRIVILDRGVRRVNCELDLFRKSVKKIVMAFEKEIPKNVKADGLMHVRTTDGTLEMVLLENDSKKIDELAEKLGAKRWQQAKMSLEDQFIEYTTQNEKRKMFTWEVK